MTKGILLLSFGKPAYHQMAIHMAASIKFYNPDVPITLLTDSQGMHTTAKVGLKVFDKVDMIPEKYLKPNGKMNPGHCKLMIPKMLPYDVTLFLDVDGCAINDVTPLLDIDKDFAAIVVDKGTKANKIEYMFWANANDSYSHFELQDTDTWYALQSSAMLFRKGDTVDKLSEYIDKYIDFPLGKLSNQWGGCIPDELIYSGAAAKLKADPDFGTPTVFFGHKYSLSVNKASQKFKILSMYGNGQLVKLIYRDWYDRHVQNVMVRLGKNKLANIHYLSRQKHVA